ncbi:MAG: hemerythrin domain-containing protein [Methylobacter tundripaludum]|uniref:Hemerythrin n=1 Tax=Methylobacter tundripaludum TaxID=173365 RepID=A0A2S6GXE7_9GAMM|nr:hemerythrin domain-containing protein [Methylobacter tundripaludum]MCK9637394.1 hemerythrin domain-containing protein [Methylobacter tundripaludum]PPK69912.1 hemerythrin [Methylobacter tundripaludum]
MPIKWDSRFSVDNSTIDMEHKLLLTLLNVLEVVLRNPHEKDSVRFFIDQLYESAREHFIHEEKLQIKYMFPYYEENKTGHEALIVELDAIREEIYKFINKTGASQNEADSMSEKINHVLRDWLIDHILKSDMKMKGFMNDAR